MSGGTLDRGPRWLRAATQPPLLFAAGLAAVAGVALYLRAHALHLYALEQDPAEYAYAVQQRYLPHSPYVLYLWIGMALEPLLPPDVAYSVVSLVCDTAATLLLGLLGARLSGSRATGVVAALLYAVSPLAAGYGGLQEVYAPQSFLVLAAILLATRPGLRAAAAAGLLFGAAFALHNASVYAGPVFALVLAGWPRGGVAKGARLRRLLAGGATAALLPLVAYGWLAFIFAENHPGNWVAPWLRYLKGIAPRPDLGALTASALVRQAGEHGAFVLRTIFSPPYRVIPAAVLGAGVVLAAFRHRRLLIICAAYGLPFSAYETLLGRNVDPGVYVPFLLPPIALLAGVAVVETARLIAAIPGGIVTRVAGVAASAAVVYLLAFPAFMTARGIGDMILDRDAFFDFPLTRAAVWFRDHLPEDAYVVQPDDPPHQHLQQNVYLLPYYAERRPIVSYHGRKMVWMGGPWAPLNMDSFVDATDAAIHRLLAARIPVVGLVPEAFYTRTRLRPRRWLRRQMRITVAGRAITQPYYLLVFARGSAAARAR